MTTTDPNSGTACDWTVSGMDCGSCAAKIKDAVTRLPGVSGVEIGIMSERLRRWTKRRPAATESKRW